LAWSPTGLVYIEHGCTLLELQRREAAELQVLQGWMESDLLHQ
jgi:hypothetical protein